jgi:LmbE family N-acetylglucosaminyl deacetylase
MSLAVRRVPFALLVLALAGAAAVGATAAEAPAGTGGGIYTCTTPDGRRLTSDRPIPECNAREQRQLNNDGSLKRVVPPQLTAEERAEKDARDRRAEIERQQQLDAVRRDRNLVARYPDEATHRKAREAALDTVRLAMKTSELRLSELASERKPMLQEAEFYKGKKQLPVQLRQQLEGNEAATEAQRTAIQNQQAELERINRLYDAELARLRKLWSGAAPGSVAP